MQLVYIQNEEFLYYPGVCTQRDHKISTYYQRYLSGLFFVHEVYTGTE